MLREKVVFVIIKVRFLTLINTFRRKIMSLLYISFDILLIGYIFYSWYWQANIDYKARFRSSSVIWALIFLLIGFYLDYFTDPTVLMNVFIAGLSSHFGDNSLQDEIRNLAECDI